MAIWRALISASPMATSSSIVEIALDEPSHAPWRRASPTSGAFVHQLLLQLRQLGRENAFGCWIDDRSWVYPNRPVT